MIHSDIWVPEGSTQHAPEILGQFGRPEGSKWVQGWRFTFTNPKNNRTQLVVIPAAEDESTEAIEQMVGEAWENFIRDTDLLPPLAVHTVQRRKEIGRAIREVREYRAKRKASTNGQIYYEGGVEN